MEIDRVYTYSDSAIRSPSALRRLVARHPVADFLIMAYTVSIKP